MNPRDIYEQIISEITDIETRRLAREMSRHVGKANRITKKQLTIFMFSKVTDATERKTRLIIHNLVTNHHYPICAHSGISGYWLAANRDEVIESAQDSESRAQESINRALALRMCELPAVLPEERARALQASLL